MSARSHLVLFTLLALAVLTVGVAPLPTVVGDASGAQTTATPAERFPTERTTINVQLRENGNANWTITTRFAIDDEANEEAFRDLAARYESGTAEPPWLDEVAAANAAAESATGRQMEITDNRTSSNVSGTALSLHFTWTNFARQESDYMVVDDAFNTTRGTWLDGLTENQVLVFELPKGYGVMSAPNENEAQFDFDDRTEVRWTGPQQFEPGYMQIRYSGDASTPSPTDPPENDGLLWGGFFVLGIGAVVVGAYVLSQRRGGLPSPSLDDGDGPDAPSAEQSEPEQTQNVSAQSATAGTVEPAVEEPDDEIDEELLSDEERVERLLETNGGRMKQATIVKETGWSNAKVSQLLSAMEEEGHVDKLRIGRENLISFPDEDVTDVDQE